MEKLNNFENVSRQNSFFISYYKSLTDKTNTSYELSEIFQMIRGDINIKQIIEQLRNETNKDNADFLKKKLPAITPSGLFDGQRKSEQLIKYSGFICLDFDNIKNTYEVKNFLSTDLYTYCVFISPSGNGIKLFVRVKTDAKKHAENFHLLQSYYSKKYKLILDKSCKDITRLMFLSYDKDLYVNENSKEWNLTEYNKYQIESLLEIFKKKETFSPGNRNNFIFKFASICLKEGFDKTFCQTFLLEKYADNDFKNEEIFNPVNSAYSYTKNESKTEDINSNNISFSALARVENYINEKYEIRFNEVNTKIEIREKSVQGIFKELNDNSLRRELEHNNIKITLGNLGSLLQSDFVIPYNPFQEYFNNLKEWKLGDEDYILKLASYIPAKDRERFELHLKKMLVRSVACSIDDKIFNKQVFILVHDLQNSGKSTFCRWLCPPVLKDYIAENINTDKDSLIALATNFIINMDELATLNKVELNSLKSFTSKDKISVRLPYSKRAQTMPRRANFIGSTNKDEFLTDETGSVRWLCFELTDMINFKYKSEVDIDDVWRQAYSLYNNGFDFQLTPKEIAENELANKAFQVNSIEFQIIQNTYYKGSKESGGTFITAANILKKISFDNPEMRFNISSVGKAMKQLGFKRLQDYCKNSKYSIYGYFVIEIS